jgi:gamma-glutamyltranspeptidase/glutathione hydrolase
MRGVIAAGDSRTVAAGEAILRMEGNAVDAAVAAAFTSFIAEVGVVHLGGSGVAQVFKPEAIGSAYHCHSYDFFSAMPGLGFQHPNKDLDFQKVTIDFGPTSQDFYLGRGAVAVPGNIAGLCRMATDFGTLRLHSLLEPAIELANNGVGLSSFQAETCELLTPIFTHTEELAGIFAGNGRMIQAGENMFIPGLSDTLNSLAKEGVEYSRTGHLAKAFLEDQLHNGGLVTSEDLLAYKVKKRGPIIIPYREYEILLPPPSSSGGVLTAFTLKLLSHFNLQEYTYGSAEHLRLLYEIMAATSRARPIWDRAEEELSWIDATNYFLSDSLVSHFTEEVLSSLSGKGRLPSFSDTSPHPDTSHISVIDENGLAVSLTTTAGESAGYVVPGTGFIPNNILGEEDLHPKGFHARPPGERIHTMMTPTFVLLDGRIRLVVGSGGSVRIRSAIMQVLSNLLDYKMRLIDAVNAPRVHLEKGVLQCELGYQEEAVNTLEEWDYPVNRWDKRSIYFGGAHSVSRTNAGRLVAAGDSRRGGSVAVVE